MTRANYKLEYRLKLEKMTPQVRLFQDKEEALKFAKALKGCHWSLMEFNKNPKDPGYRPAETSEDQGHRAKNGKKS